MTGTKDKTIMLTNKLIIQAVRAGHEYGLAEAEVAAERANECGRWPEWTTGAYAGWLPEDDDQRAAYDDLLDRAAQAAYEAVRDAITATQEVR